MKIEKLAVEYVPLDQLLPYPKNNKKHSEKGIEKLAKLISEFGFTNPILVDEDLIILAGHGRLLAAQRLKMETAPVIVAAGLTNTQKRQIRISDNRIGIEDGPDVENLLSELMELSELDCDMSLTGYDAEDLEALFNGSTEEETEEGQGKAKNSVSFTDDQYQTVLHTIAAVRRGEQDENISEGRCIELACGDFLSGHA